MTSKKEFLIDIFLKKSKHSKIIKDIFDYNSQLFKRVYHKIPDKEFEEIINKYKIEECNKRTKSIIDNNFSEEELKIILDFYCSPLGEKTIHSDFTRALDKMMKEIINEVENKLSIKASKIKNE